MISAAEFEAWKDANGYEHARVLADGRILAVTPQTFGKFRLNVGSLDEIFDGY